MRPWAAVASGVIGMNLDDEDGKNQVVGMLTIDANGDAQRARCSW